MMQLCCNIFVQTTLISHFCTSCISIITKIYMAVSCEVLSQHDDFISYKHSCVADFSIKRFSLYDYQSSTGQVRGHIVPMY